MKYIYIIEITFFLKKNVLNNNKIAKIYKKNLLLIEDFV